MSFATCSYINCWNRNISSNNLSMFPFPVKDHYRLKLWIRNTGNMNLNELSENQLRKRVVCAAHFDASSMHIGPKRSRLIGPAIPIPYQLSGVNTTGESTSDDCTAAETEMHVDKCCIRACGKVLYDGCQTTFHGLPKNEIVKQKWLAVTNCVFDEHSLICSNHFKEDDFEPDSERQILKPTAVPSILPKVKKSSAITRRSEIAKTSNKPNQGVDKDQTSLEPNAFQICRVCMSQSATEPFTNDLKTIFLEISGIHTFQEKLKKDLPLALCLSCLDEFNKCIAFRENAQRANKAMCELKEHGELTKDNIKRLADGENITDILLEGNTEDHTDLTSGPQECDSEGTSEDEINDVIMEDRTMVGNTLLKETDNAITILCYTHKNKRIGESERDNSSDDDLPLSTKHKPTSKQTSEQTSKQINTKRKIQSFTHVTKIKNISVSEDKKAYKQAHKTKDKTNEKKTSDLLKHFTLSLLDEIEQKVEFEKRQLDKFYLDKKYKCLLCFRSFVSQPTYDRHMAFQHTETPERPFKCHICSTYFIRKSYLNKHVLTHSELYKCRQCDFITDKRTAAELHVFWHQGKEYECKQCSKTFKHRSTLYNHKRVEHAADCLCPLCGFSFTNEWGLKFHLRRIHRQFDKDFKAPENGPLCVECDIRFVTEEALETHRRVSPKHATGTNRQRNDPSAFNTREPLLSKTSNKTAPRTDVIDPNNALKRQKGEMRNQCVQCEKCAEVHPTFFAYKKHFRTAHPGEIRTQFPRLSKQLLCDHCGKVFRSKAYLRDHMYKHTKLSIRCTDCSKSFYSRYAYALHRQAHLGVKYPCKLCGKTFTRQANRERHAVTVHNVRSIKCDFCDKFFKSEEVQKIHTDHVHFNKPWPKRVRNRDGHRPVARRDSN